MTNEEQYDELLNSIKASNTEIKDEFKNFKTELKDEFRNFKAEMKNELKVLKDEIRTEFADSKLEIEKGLESLSDNLHKSFISETRWYLGVIVTIVVIGIALSIQINSAISFNQSNLTNPVEVKQQSLSEPIKAD